MINTDKKKYNKTLVIPIEHKTWASLRQIAFERQTSMSELTRAALEKIINKYEKAS